MARPLRPLEIRFQEKVEVRSKKECWPWKGTFVGPYGSILRGGRPAQDLHAMIIINGIEMDDGDETSRPVVTACVECGENTPENGLVCDECLEDALGD